MASRQYQGGGEILRWYRGKVAEATGAVEDVMMEAGQKGEDLVKYYIETRGVNGKRGRVVTGNMRDAVGHRYDRDSKGQGRMSFGWINQKEQYFLDQEGGTKHIEAMYAIADAGEEIFYDLNIDIGKALKRV